MPCASVDDAAIRWQPFGDLPHFVFAPQDVDRTRRVAVVPFKFSVGQQVVLHRHKGLSHIFVVSGEHCLDEMDCALARGCAPRTGAAAALCGVGRSRPCPRNVT